MSRTTLARWGGVVVVLSAVVAASALSFASSEQRARQTAREVLASVEGSEPRTPPSTLILAQNDTGKNEAKKKKNASAPEQPGQRKLVNGTRIGAWTVRCEAVAVGETACALVQQLFRPSDRAFIAEIMAVWNKAAARPVLIARVPLGVHLPGGFVIQAEGEEQQRNFVWQRCLGRFCEATLALEPEDLATYDKARQVVGAFRPAPNAAPFVFRFAMSGLRQGLDALGADSPAQETGGKKKKKKN